MQLNLAEQIRDDDPALVWRYLKTLDAERLTTLAMVSIAAVPSGSDLQTTFGWVMELPVARLAS
ncbi:Uncharacterised protein [Mycobacterium tuberculosis]|nr:Uncharacterised protein [Mycobacterium tuberculosis]